jgi:peptidyl-prolyl cis-trans isomerase C
MPTLNGFSPGRSLSRLALAAMTALALAACGGGGDRPPEAGDRPVARVAGSLVYASDVKREAVAQGLVGEDEPLDPTSDLFGRMLDEVVDQKLLAREAERRGLDNSDAARRRLNAARERILGDMLVESVVEDAVSEKAVQALYAEQRRLARQGEEIRARQIVTPSQADAQAVARLLATGAAFDQLALERSTDAATRFSGGDLGYFTLDVMPPAYGFALRGVQPGQVVGPFQTEAGWVVMKVEDRRPEQPLTLEEARPQIVRFLTYDRIRQLLEDLERRAEVEVLVEGVRQPQEPASAPKTAAAPPANAAAKR